MINDKLIRRRRWLIFIGVCLLLIFLFYERIADLSEIDFLSALNMPDLPPLVVFFILAGSTLISEDLTCLTAGTLVAQGAIGFPLAVAACGFGIFVGDIMLFWTGRFFGRRALKMKIIRRLVSERALKKSSLWLEKYGMVAVLLSRFTPGLRLPLYLMAGVLKTDFLKFTLYFLFATILWTPFIIGIPAFFGREILESEAFQGNFWLGFFVVVAGFYILLRFALRLTSWKGRRLLLGRLKRLYKWEFWPLPVFYFPVIIYILGLMFRHRSLTVFTCANPALPASGFVGESKAEILRGLSHRESESFLLKLTLIEDTLPFGDKLKKAFEFLSKNKLDFPLAVKPDVGERGTDVFIIRSTEELASVFEKSNADLILQEYAPGREVSVFYYRYPHQRSGQIFSITEKRFPFVAGDGESTLEDLILADARAICLADKYFQRNEERLFDIPEKGARVQLIDIGTHSRGAVFLEGGHLKTDLLEKRFDEICRRFQGFYFGRFDIRTKNLEDFKRGENFKIIELNGVTSEATNIYDPQYTLREAYKILFRQWKIAFEIGAENQKRGEQPTRVGQLLKLIFDFGF